MGQTRKKEDTEGPKTCSQPSTPLGNKDVEVHERQKQFTILDCSLKVI